MKLSHSSPNQDTNSISSAVVDTSSGIDAGDGSFTPAPDEVAMRAYLNYVSNGSQPGRDVEHWLEAEAQLRAESSGAISPLFQERT